MKQTAKVITAENGYATVKVSRKSACELCHNSGSSCSACFTFSDKKAVTRARNDAGAAPGDTVTIETASGKVLIYSAALFLLPTLISLVAYYVAGLLDVPATAISVVFFITAFIGAAAVCERSARRGFDVIISGVIKQGKINNKCEDIQNQDED